MTIKVLIADDQMLIRQGIRGLLELDDRIEVVGEAEDGEDALTKIAALKPQICLLDVRMPRKTGIDVVLALRAAKDATPVILLTTVDDKQMLLEGVRAGISGFLLKGVSADELMKAILAVSKGETLILPAITEQASKYVKEQKAEFGSADMPDTLSARELEVLRLMAGGYSNREIADALGTAEGTVKNQASSIMSKSCGG